MVKFLLLQQRFSAEPFNFSPGITSNPPIPHAETPYQKKYNISPSVESNTVNDSDVREITESNKTTQEKPEGLTFEEYRKIRPEVTFDEYRKIWPYSSYGLGACSQRKDAGKKKRFW